MFKYGVSVVAGAVALGFLSIVYTVGFDYLYVSISIKDKMEYCGQFFDQFGACKGVGYFLLWVRETPLLIITFMALSLALLIANRYVSALKFYGRYVVISYLVFYLAMTKLGEYGDAFPLFSWYNLGVAVYHGSLFMGSLYIANHLTKSSKVTPKSGAL